MFIKFAELSARYGGVSDMTIRRWIASEGFPKPVRFKGTRKSVRFWDTAALDKHDRLSLHRQGQEDAA